MPSSAGMPTRFVIFTLATLLSSGGALAQHGGGASRGGSTGSTGGGAIYSPSTSGGMTSPSLPGGASRPLPPGSSPDTQPRFGSPPDTTGELQRSLSGPATPDIPSTQSSGMQRNQGSSVTDGVSTDQGGEQPVVPPTALECQRGWHPGERWTREELTKYCRNRSTQ